MELKGRGDELWAGAAAAQPWLKSLSLRVSASADCSSIDGIPGPGDRLVQQQSWAAATDSDQVPGPLAGGPPLTVVAHLAWTPGDRSLQTHDQAVTTTALRKLDVSALWAIDRQTMLRLGGANLLADGNRSTTILLPDQGVAQAARNSRASRRSFNAGVVFKF